MLLRPSLREMTLWRPTANMYRASVWIILGASYDNVDVRIALHAATAVVIIAVSALVGADSYIQVFV
jgi:hypothetical protein